MKGLKTACAVLALCLATAAGVAQNKTGSAPGGVWAGSPGVTAFRSDSEMRQLMTQGLVSPDAAPLLQRAYRAIQAKDWGVAIARCKDAQALLTLAPFDHFMIDYFLGVAYYRSGDLAAAAASYFAAAQSPAAPVDLRNDAILSGVQLANDAKQKDKAVALVGMAEKAGIAGEKLFDIAAVATFDSGDFAGTESWAKKAIDAAAKTGGSASHTTWQMLLLAQSRQQEFAAEMKTLEIMCPRFGDKRDWGSLIDITFGQMSELKKVPGVEVAALYLYRLRFATEAASIADDYVFGAQLALALNSPGDAQTALALGNKANLLSGNADAAKTAAEADKRAAADQAALAKADDLAAKAKTGDAAVSVGEGYFGYQRYGDAARLAALALAKGGRKANEARLLLGAAQTMSGDRDAAVATLKTVAGDEALQRAAHLWSLYAGHQYGQEPAPPAATK
jgi:hypothetical protein